MRTRESQSNSTAAVLLSSTVRPLMKLQRYLPIFLPIVVLAITACASGSAIVTGTKRMPITSEHVTLYLEPPIDYEVIGLVSASSDAGWTEQATVDYAVEELKKQAAKLGANGLLLLSSGDTTTVVGGHSVSGKTVQGKAIFVKEQ
jgi:hypothetical protein